MPKHISFRYFKTSPEIIQLSLETSMASRLERLSFDALLAGVRRATLPRQSAFLFATARKRDRATPRKMVWATYRSHIFAWIWLKPLRSIRGFEEQRSFCP